jgi:hypothetical protein
MTDLALRRQVAEARGWTSIRISGKHTIGGVPPFDYIGSFLTIPPYDTDIAAAWELLDRLRYDIDNTTGPSGVTVIIWMDNGEPVSALAATAPAAICKAWLNTRSNNDRLN